MHRNYALSLGNCQAKYNAQRKKTFLAARTAREADIRGIRWIHSKYSLITFSPRDTFLHACLPIRTVVPLRYFLTRSQKEGKEMISHYRYRGIRKHFALTKPPLIAQIFDINFYESCGSRAHPVKESIDTRANSLRWFFRVKGRDIGQTEGNRNEEELSSSTRRIYLNRDRKRGKGCRILSQISE